MTQLSKLRLRQLRNGRLAHLIKLTRQYGRRCWYCGTPFHSFRFVELDHIVPSSRGGKSEIENYAVACKPCNRAKEAMPLHEFLAWLRKPKSPLPHIHERAKQDEQHWRDWGPAIAKGLRKPSSPVKTNDRRIAYNVRVVDEVKEVEEVS